MKILVASTNHEHAAPMHINYYHALVGEADVIFFGPGFSTKAELQKGIKKYIDENGPFDAVICTFPLILSSINFFSIREIYKWHRYFISDFSISEAIRYSSGIIDELCQFEGLKIILYGQDYVNLSEEWEKVLIDFWEKNFYWITYGEDFVPEVSENTNKTFGAGLSISNRYRRLVQKYSDKIISIPYEAVAGNEYCFTPLENRPYDWVVPGNIDGCYPARSKILHQVESAGYTVYSKFIDRTMAYKVSESRVQRCQYNREIDMFVDSRLPQSNCYMQSSIKREEIARWRENYSVSIRNSKVAYADGGEGHSLVQKYVEIPVRGTLLACENVCGLDKLGFSDGENMVVVSPENVLEISRELFASPEKMQRIAEAGRKLVITKHTSQKRAQDTIRAIRAILNNEFKGSYWDKGEFHIIR